MSLLGRALLAFSHDVTPGSEPDWTEWHDREHIPERLSIPGFLRLRRYVALGAGPRLLILDEPAAGLNTHEAERLGHTLKGLIGGHVEAILLVEHNMALVMAVSDHIVVLDFGRKIAQGTPTEVRANPDVVAAYLGKPAV